MLLGGRGQFEEFFLGPVLRANPVLLVELAEVIDVIDVVTDTLKPNIRLDTSGAESRLGGAPPNYQRPLSVL